MLKAWRDGESIILEDADGYRVAVALADVSFATNGMLRAAGLEYTITMKPIEKREIPGK